MGGKPWTVDGEELPASIPKMLARCEQRQLGNALGEQTRNDCWAIFYPLDRPSVGGGVDERYCDGVDLVSHHIEKLVDKSVAFSIGEPWDFKSDAGPNVLTGKIIDAAITLKNEQALLCEVSRFRDGENYITQVLATPRYFEREELFSDVLRGGSCPCNFSYHVSGLELPSVDSFLNSKQELGQLIGSIGLK